MAVITAQQVHAHNWRTCPRCDGGKALTTKEIRQGASCTYCDGKGEVARYPAKIVNIWFGYGETL